MPALKLTKPSCITVVPGGQVRAEADPVGVGDPDAGRARRSRSSAGTCRPRRRRGGARRPARCSRSSSTRSGGHGPAEVQATLVSSAEDPVQVGLVRPDQPVREQVQPQVRVGGVLRSGSASDSMTTTVATVRRPGSGLRSPPRAAAGTPGAGRGTPAGTSVAGGSPRPRRRPGYQVSSTWPSAVSVARPRPQAGEVRWLLVTAKTLPEGTTPEVVPSGAAEATTRKRGLDGGGRTSLLPGNSGLGTTAARCHSRDVPRPTPVALTRALVDVESVSGNEKADRRLVEEVAASVRRT